MLIQKKERKYNEWTEEKHNMEDNQITDDDKNEDKLEEDYIDLLFYKSFYHFQF